MTVNLKIELTANAFEKWTDSQAVELVSKYLSSKPKPVSVKMVGGLLQEVFLIDIAGESYGNITCYTDISNT